MSIQSAGRPSSIVSLFAFAIWFAAAASGGEGPQSAQEARARAGPDGRPNILIIIADDMGVDKVGVYAEHPDPPPTPNIDALAARGVLFRNAYSDAVCSPTRATIMTGRHGFRTGLGRAIQVGQHAHALTFEEITLPEMLEAGTGGLYSSSAVGKWHLGTLDYGDTHSPLYHGFDWFGGTLGNFHQENQYFAWNQVIQGKWRRVAGYATSWQTTDAVVRIHAMPEPWLMWLAFNAAHRPWHAPPGHLHSQPLMAPPQSTPVEHYAATVEAMDREIGRLFASIDPQVLANTVVIFVGDNGTPEGVTTPPFVRTRAKGTVYEGGVNVPLIIAGPGVVEPGRECAAIVNTVDLFETVADLTGVDLGRTIPSTTPVDGVSLLPYLEDPAAPPQRSWVYSEYFAPNGRGPYTEHRRGVRDERWKLIEGHDEHGPLPDEFYDMQGRSMEGLDLLLGRLNPEQEAAYLRLKAVADMWRLPGKRLILP